MDRNWPYMQLQQRYKKNCVPHRTPENYNSGDKTN
jgi:hypothetical protein